MAIARQVEARPAGPPRGERGSSAPMDNPELFDGMLSRVRSETREFQFSALLGAQSVPGDLFRQPSAIPVAVAQPMPRSAGRGGLGLSAAISALVALLVSMAFQASLAGSSPRPTPAPPLNAAVNSVRTAPFRVKTLQAASRTPHSVLTLAAARDLARMQVVLEADSAALIADEQLLK